MIIAFVSDAIYPYNKGGKEARLYEISRRLIKMGYQVHIFCMQWWEGEKVKIEDDVVLHGVCKNIKLYNKKGSRSIKQAIWFAWRLLPNLWRFKFDAIEVDHMPYFPIFSAKLACLIRRKKMVCVWHEVWGGKYWRQYAGFFVGTIATVIERLASKLPSKIIAISELTRDRLTTILKVNPDKVRVIAPYGIETDEAELMSEKKYDCFYHGRLLKHKNIELLVEALIELSKKNRKVTGLIVGEGPEEERLKSLVVNNNLENQIVFKNFIASRTELLRLLSASRIFTMPSEREGFGISLLEAQALGVPPITLDHPSNAAKYLIEPGINGLLVKKDRTDLAEKISWLLDHQNEYHQMSLNAMENAKKFNWNEIIKKCLSIYEQTK